MNQVEKLNQIWLDKLSKNETINIKDLYQFSKINLKRKRFRKKFEKKYYKYISNELWDTYIGILLTIPIINSFKREINFEIPLVDSINKPIGKLYY